MDNTYFVNKEPQEVAATLIGKIQAWKNSSYASELVDKIRRSWQAYHGNFFNNIAGDHTLNFTGEEGELVQMGVNHYRNIAMHLLNMTTANRPSIQARATNTDYKSMAQTILANSLLDYYMREKRVEKYLKKAAEYAIVLGEGYIKMEWDAKAGALIGHNDELNVDVYEGDIRYINLSPLDVVRDSSREDDDHDWIITRSYKNKYDLAAKYPELENELMGIQNKSDDYNNFFDVYQQQESDLIPIYEFYHRRSDAVPDGHYMLFCSEQTIMHTGPLPYRDIPVFKITPSNFIGAPYGYTSMFDLLPVQEGVNSLYSVIMTNQNAFGVQNVLVPHNSNVQVSQIAGALNIIGYNPQYGKPEPINFTNTPAEIFNMIERLENTMETLSGINSVTRGNPEASLKSGAALALVQAQAVQFASGLQQSYVQLVEDVSTATIKLLQDFAESPRVAAIAGKANRSYMKQFTGNDLSNINRVIVEISNPLSKTTAGKLEIANQLIQMGLIKNVDQYFTVLNTGRLESMIEGEQAELLLIRAENEKMMDGTIVPVLALDNHMTHINEHKVLFADPDLRMNPELMQRVLDHIQQHVVALKTTDPELLQITGQQPLPSAQQSQMGPQGEPVEKPQGETSPMSGPEVGGALQEPLPVGAAQVANVPSVPSPPPPFQNLPTNPAEGQ
jgi:hypothetical protein